GRRLAGPELRELLRRQLAGRERAGAGRVGQLAAFDQVERGRRRVGPDGYHLRRVEPALLDRLDAADGEVVVGEVDRVEVAAREQVLGRLQPLVGGPVVVAGVD